MKLAILCIVCVLAGAALGGLAGWYALDALEEFGRWCDQCPWAKH